MRVREHLLKELIDTTSLADMLRMARVCEGTVHSEEIFKQYLESVKTVKQVDVIHQWNNSKSKDKGRGCGGHRSHSRSQSRKPGGCSNCGSSHTPKKCKAYDKECCHCHKKGHFSQFCYSKCHDWQYIMSDPQVPFKKTERKIDSFTVYCETESHNKSHMKNCSLSPTYSIPKSKHVHNFNLNKKSVSDFHICKNKLKKTKWL